MLFFPFFFLTFLFRFHSPSQSASTLNISFWGEENRKKIYIWGFNNFVLIPVFLTEKNGEGDKKKGELGRTDMLYNNKA